MLQSIKRMFRMGNNKQREEENDVEKGDLSLLTKKKEKVSASLKRKRLLSMRISMSPDESAANSDIVDEMGIAERLHHAIWPRNNEEAVAVLLGDHPGLINTKRCTLLDTPLIRAARYGRVRMVQLLLDLGADPNESNAMKQTAIHVACNNQKEDVVRALLESPDINCNVQDSQGDAPIHLACKGGSMTILNLMMERSVCGDGDDWGYLGNTLLHYASQYARLEVMEYILQFADVNAANVLGETPLHLAAGSEDMEGGIQHLTLLIEKGADLNARCEWGDTAVHYAARSGSLESLEHLISNGVSMTKRKHTKAKKEKLDRLQEEFSLSHECREEMNWSFLQKVAKSGCIMKANWVIKNITDARQKFAKNEYAGYILNRKIQRVYAQVLHHQELSDKQQQFLDMAKELHRTMKSPNSALRLFIKYSPDCVEYLLNQCVVNCYGETQVQGEIFFDLFLFFPCKPSCAENYDDQDAPDTELALPEILIEANKERFLTHPIFEVFLKLKWHRSWRTYLGILAFYALFVTSVILYSLLHFGTISDPPFDPTEMNWSWWFATVTTSVLVLLEISKFVLFGKYLSMIMAKRKSRKKSGQFVDSSNKVSVGRITQRVVEKSKEVFIALFSIIVISTDMNAEHRKYVSAALVILSCFEFMIALSRLPRVGIYIFMLNKVAFTIMRFFITYIWHFIGYAVAFHLVMPRDNDGPFGTFSNSLIKVLTMLMGEYEYEDNFLHSPWLAKIIFAVFVIDMSVVLMNLILGLAVADVDSILQHSKVRRMVHETLTVTYLEKLCANFGRMPVFRRMAKSNDFNITRSTTCSFKEFTFVNLIDVVPHEGNEIVLDRGVSGGEMEKFPLAKEIVPGLVSLLKTRLPSVRTRPEDVLLEVKNQNAQMREKMKILETHLETFQRDQDQQNCRRKVDDDPMKSVEETLAALVLTVEQLSKRIDDKK